MELDTRFKTGDLVVYTGLSPRLMEIVDTPSSSSQFFDCYLVRELDNADTMFIHSSFLSFPASDVVSKNEGIKHDSGKPKLSMLTLESLAYEAAAFEYGAKKYEKNNYKAGMDWTRVSDAALRHLTAWTNKQDLDSESGLNHLAHAKACLAMLIYYVENKVGKDDR